MYSLLLMRALKISSELKKSEFCILSVICIYVLPQYDTYKPVGVLSGSVTNFGECNSRSVRVFTGLFFF